MIRSTGEAGTTHGTTEDIGEDGMTLGITEDTGADIGAGTATGIRTITAGTADGIRIGDTIMAMDLDISETAGMTDITVRDIRQRMTTGCSQAGRQQDADSAQAAAQAEAA